MRTLAQAGITLVELLVVIAIKNEIATAELNGLSTIGGSEIVSETE